MLCVGRDALTLTLALYPVLLESQSQSSCQVSSSVRNTCLGEGVLSQGFACCLGRL